MVTENAKAYGCSRYREGCKFAIWKMVAGKRLTERQAQMLLTRGATDQLKGFKSKAGKPFAARLKLDAEFKVSFDFDEPWASGEDVRSQWRRRRRQKWRKGAV